MTEEHMNYADWCAAHGMNPDNDDNYELYCRWLKEEK